MSHVLDIILIAFVLLVVFVSSKRGIVITLFDIASAVIATLFARLMAPRAAVYLYDSFIKERVLAFLTEKYSGIGNQLAGVLGNITSVFDFLPKGMLEYANSSGFLDSQAMSESIMSSITTVEELETHIVSPVVHSLLNIICFSVLAFVLAALLRIAGRLLAKLVKKSEIAEKLDSALGAVFGLIKGLIYMVILSGIVCVISYSSETLAAYAADSYICSFVSSLIGI